MSDKFYKTTRWQRTRAGILRRDKYMCQYSKRFGKTVEATTVHHIFPRKEFPEYAWEDWNLISVSAEVHNQLEDRQSGNLSEKGLELLKYTAKKRGIPLGSTTLVIGLPGTGKTTYVQNHLGADGIAYDLDAISAAFRLKAPHEEYHQLSRQMANDLLVGFVSHTKAYRVPVYVIRTAPSRTDVEEIAPDEIVVMQHKYADRPIDDERELLNRIEEAVDFARSRGIRVRRAPPT